MAVPLSVLQIRTLCWKSLVFAKRKWLTTLFRLFFGAICVAMFGVLLIITNSGEIVSPEPDSPLGGIPKCKVGVTGQCVTIYYSPDTTEIQSIMKILGQQNNPELILGEDILPTNLTQIEFQFFVNSTSHMNETQGAVFFNIPANETLLDSLLIDRQLSYTLMYNGTEYSDPLSFVPPTPYMNYQYQTQIAVDRAVMTHFNNGTNAPNIQVAFKPYPKTTNPMMEGLILASIEVILFLALSLPFIITVMQVNSERVSGQRGYMKLVGLRDFPWWVSSTIDQMGFYIIAMILLIVIGYAFYPPIEYFRQCNFLVHVLVYLDYGFAMFTLGMLVCTLVSDKKFVVIVVFSVICFGLTLAFTVMFSDAGIYGLWNPEFTGKYGPWGVILTFFPGWALLMVVLVIKLQTSGYVWTTNLNSQISGGFTLADMYSNPEDLNLPDYVPTVNYFLLFMFFLGIAFWVLAIYFDLVLSDPYRASLHPLFFLQPKYWGLGKSKRGVPSENDTLLSKGANVDADVLEERKTVLDNLETLTLAVSGLVKQFPAKKKFGCCGPVKTPALTAVDGLYLAAEKGTLLCLLGHNGAGKTTTINILTGVVKASPGGNAFIQGLDVNDKIQQIREIMGVCPQFDILWNDLTAAEHLYLVSGLKRTNWISRQQAEHYLDDVKLLKVADNNSDTFSGGMKRRLSLAMSICTEPVIVFMDEPTTGMDPGNRRHIWETIVKFKPGKLIILTTHSMEEAEVLGEKIAIMAHGQLKCVGNALRLKAKYGCGYRLSLITAEANVDAVKQIFNQRLPEAELIVSNAGSLVFGLPVDDLNKSAVLFQYLRNATYQDPETGEVLPLVSDWGISQTTLEDVFIRTTTDAHDEFKHAR